MIAAISQPSFIPYGGYFSLINNVNDFIFLDDVQFDKRSWQQRNFIRISGNPKLITIPEYDVGLLSKYGYSLSESYERRIASLKKAIKSISLKYIRFRMIFWMLLTINLIRVLKKTDHATRKSKAAILVFFSINIEPR